MATPINRDRLIKILGMLASDADGEVLMAARRAVEMLRAANKTWDDVLTGGNAVSSGSRTYGAPASDFRTPPSRRGRPFGAAYRPPPRQEEEEQVRDDAIGGWLSTLAGRRHDVGTLMMLASLREFYDERGYLYRSQYEAVQRLMNAGSGGVQWRF